MKEQLSKTYRQVFKEQRSRKYRIAFITFVIAIFSFLGLLLTCLSIEQIEPEPMQIPLSIVFLPAMEAFLIGFIWYIYERKE